MVIYRPVVVHGLADARLALEAALQVGVPVTLLSAPGAGVYGGCLWWRSLVAAAGATVPGAEAMAVLDCADASGMAMGALRTGVSRLVLWPDAPGWAAVAAIAQRQGGFVLPQAPPSLDLGVRGAERRLRDWLRHG